MEIGTKIRLTKDVRSLKKGDVCTLHLLAYKEERASEECRQKKWIYVHSEKLPHLQLRLSEGEYELADARH